MGQCAAAVHEIKPAREIVDSMIAEAIEALRVANSYIQPRARL